MIDRDLTNSELTLYVRELNKVVQTLTTNVSDLKTKIISLEKSADFAEEEICNLQKKDFDLEERLDNARH